MRVPGARGVLPMAAVGLVLALLAGCSSSGSTPRGDDDSGARVDPERSGRKGSERGGERRARSEDGPSSDTDELVRHGDATDRSPAVDASTAGETAPAPDATTAHASAHTSSHVEATPTFDARSATGARVRIVRVYRRGWVPCGVVHCVGAVLVDVVGGPRHMPAPQLVLELSCPADYGWPAGTFQPGAELTVRLYRKRQPWPRAWAREKLPSGVVTRQVAAIWPSGV